MLTIHRLEKFTELNGLLVERLIENLSPTSYYPGLSSRREELKRVNLGPQVPHGLLTLSGSQCSSHRGGEVAPTLPVSGESVEGCRMDGGFLSLASHLLVALQDS